LLPLLSNSSGFSPTRHESLSRMPHTVMPVQRGTARHDRVTLAYTAAWFDPEMSSSVICTSTPSAAKRCRLAWKSPGTELLRWAWNPTQSIGTPRFLKSRTML
jgi:hypothetical protein